MSDRMDDAGLARQRELVFLGYLMESGLHEYRMVPLNEPDFDRHARLCRCLPMDAVCIDLGHTVLRGYAHKGVA